MLLSFISSFLRIMTKIRRFPFFSAAAVLALTVPLSALADYPDLPPEPPRAASSFIGMGAATGTPSGDVAQAVKPVLRSLPVPTMVQSAPFNKSDLYAVPVTTNFPRPLKIGVQASLGLSSRAQWLRFTLEELKYVLGEANLEILWFDNRQLELGVKSRQLDFILADADEFALAQSTGYYEASASFLPNAAIRAEDAQAAVIFTRRGRESTAVQCFGQSQHDVCRHQPRLLGRLGRGGSETLSARYFSHRHRRSNNLLRVVLCLSASCRAFRSADGRHSSGMRT